MVNEQLPIACRYLPYDQWFITHIDPTWKIRHLKQRIISKCLNLPFDPRFTRNARPPSPITFAPTSKRPDSPINILTPSSDTGSDHQESTGEGYEEDDEGEDFGAKVNIKPKACFRQRKREQEPQITTHTYTLLRFSTGQILEEDCQIIWYDIQPHELVELHCSFPPPTFASSLVSPMSPSPNIAASPQTMSAQKNKKVSPITADQRDLPIPSLVALPRHMPKLYIQPYWQGWVRALRVVSRIQTTPASDNPFENNDREIKMDRKQAGKNEWREKWVVIHDGVINICKSLNDPNPTRIPLSSLMALRGPESLPHSKNTTKLRSKHHTPEPSTMTSKDLDHSQEAMESIPDIDSKRNTQNLKKTRKDGLLSAASYPSLRSLGPKDHQPHRMSSYSSTPTYSKSKDRDNTFIPTSREEAEQVGMKVICVTFRVQPAAGEGDKGVRPDSNFLRTRRYTSTGPSLASVAGAGGAKVKMKTSTGPQIVIDSDIYGGDQSQGHLTSPGRTTIIAGIDSAVASPISHSTGFNWNLFGGIRTDDKERKTTEKRKATHDDRGLLSPSTAAAEEFEAPVSMGWKSLSVSPSRLEKGTSSRSTEGEYLDTFTPSSPMTTRPTVVIPILTSTLATTSAAATFPPEAQPKHQASSHPHDNPHSDSSSSVSVSSPVFAHSTNESDLDDETFLRYGPSGGTTSTMSGMSGANRPRKGYRYGGYHAQAQVRKVRNEGENERLVNDSIGKAPEVEMKIKSEDSGQPQQASREQKERNKGAEREGWIALDMVNDNAFNSILRILHRHSPPSLSSSFTHYGSKDQRVPSNADDDGRYTAAAKNPAASNRAIYPPIIEFLAARAVPNHPTQHLAYVALPYPEWRLELVNQARRAGMREIGRPLDLALHGWGREFEEMAATARERKLQKEKELKRENKNKRKSVQSHVSTIKERGRKVSRVAGGSDADDDDDGDEEETMGTTQLDSDSEEESDTEWLAWMTDLPRQFLVQQSQSPVQTSHSFFSDPFSFSSLVEGGDGLVRPPLTQEEERTLHADRVRHLEPSSSVWVIHQSHLPSPTSTSFFDTLKQLPTLSSPSSFESLNQQRGSSSVNSSPFPGVSSTDDLLVNKGSHSRSQSRSLQHLGPHRYVGSVPEEGGDGYNPATPSRTSPTKHWLHHSVSMDQHLSSGRDMVDSHHQTDSIASNQNENENEFTLGKPILTNKQIMQIESEVFTSPAIPSSPSYWKYPPISVPSPPPRPSSTTRSPALLSTNASEEAKGSSSIPVINQFTTELTRWSTSLGNSLSTPSSPSISISPNSTSPPRSSVFGSLGRSPSKVGGQEKKGFLKKRISRDLAKDKDRDAGERIISPAGASPKQRPKLLIAGLSSSTSPFSPASVPLPNHPEIPFSTHNSNLASGHHLHHSSGVISSSARVLRRVHSGSNVREEERPTTPSAGLAVASPETEGKEVQKKKKGRIDRIIRGFDSSLAFAEGR